MIYKLQGLRWSEDDFDQVMEDLGVRWGKRGQLVMYDIKQLWDRFESLEGDIEVAISATEDKRRRAASIDK